MLKYLWEFKVQKKCTMVPAKRFLIFYSVLAFTATCVNSNCQGYRPTRREFNAIRQVETGGHHDPWNAVGDGGRSIGPYQIMWAYHYDAKQYDRSLPPYAAMKGPNSFDNSERVMQAYSCRYTTPRRLGRTPTFQDFARNHNGGPNGYKNSRTYNYYRKCLRYL